ncbi:MAG: sulfopyruvate decarboxylase [Chloroflexi bacterium]|nr:sulfopyruvate decarboxylase [Chloroflexota bacterium]
MSSTASNPRYAELMIEGLKEADVKIVTALPEGLLRSFYRMAADDPDIHYVRVSNEADMPGIVAGAYLGGTRAVMVMENQGIRQACHPIGHYAFASHMPMVMFLSFRGDFGEGNWWGHHHSQTMEPILKAFRIPFRVVRRLEQIKPNIKRAFDHANASQWPVALVFSGECVEVSTYAKD